MLLACLPVLTFFLVAEFGFAMKSKLKLRVSPELNISIALALGVVALAAAGLLTIFLPLNKLLAGGVVLALMAVAAGLECFRSRRAIMRQLRHSKAQLLTWALASAIAVLASYAPAAHPPTLFDGPYVFKTWYLPVQIQALTGNLPADNSIPAVATEYLVRGIDFRAERPLVPGQEVSNRPLFMAFAATPFRALFVHSTETPSPLPRFSYVGTDWPNTLSLVTEDAFRVFLAVAIPLNALIAVAFHALIDRYRVPFGQLAVGAFAIVSPYVLEHDIFTWPKNLAAFYIVLGFELLHGRRPHYLLSGIMFGLAYWSHPYASAFAGAAGLSIIIQNTQSAAKIRAAFTFGLAFVVFPALWIGWSQGLMGIPSDLVDQNFASNAGFTQLVWIRVSNLFNLLFPTVLAAPVFHLSSLLTGMTVTLALPLGLLWFLVPYAVRPRDGFAARSLIWPFAAGATICFVFSNPAVPLLHGWQAVWPFLAVSGLQLVNKWSGQRRWVLPSLLMAQLAIDVAFLTSWSVVFTTLWR